MQQGIARAAGFARRASAGARSLVINDRVDLVPDTSSPTITVVVGTAHVSGDAPRIFAGSDGWRALVSQQGPVGSGLSSNPFGAGAAACFAAANVFRHVFAKQLTCGDLDQNIDLSLLDYQQSAAPGSPLPAEIDLGDSHLAGLGAIGNGAMWALSRLPGLTGTLCAVDHDVVDLSNLQRYVMATQNDVGKPKAGLALALLKRARLRVPAHAVKWSDYVGGLKNRKFERVAVALDNAADRIGLQASLPKWIVNAWTQELDLGISRHGFGDGKACLACLYMPTGAIKSEDEKVAEELRLPEAKQQVRELLQTGHGVTEEFVQRVATAFAVPFTQLQPFVGQPLRSFHRGAICGGMMVGLTGGSNAGTAVVPMAFQSALAGIGLAADLVKHAAGLPMPPSTSTRINLLRPLAPVLSDPRARDATGRCICCDEDFIEAYRRKYPVGGSRSARKSKKIGAIATIPRKRALVGN
jgi:molybdopterin/thiamine biosynthesis adenylyltransferase